MFNRRKKFENICSRQTKNILFETIEKILRGTGKKRFLLAFLFLFPQCFFTL